MSQNISDAELERYLRRRDPLSSEYAALGREEPSAELDALVLARAREALDEDAGSVNWRRRRWPAFTALAATVVLSFAIITRITIDSDQAMFAPTAPSQAPAASPEPGSVASPDAGLASQPAAVAAPYGSLEAAAPATSARDARIGNVAGASEPLLLKRQNAEGFAPPADLARSDTSGSDTSAIKAGVQAGAAQDMAAQADADARTNGAAASSAERVADEGSPSVFQTYEALRAEQRAREREQAAAEEVASPAVTVTGSRILTERVRARPSNPQKAVEAKVAPARFEASASTPAAPAALAPAAQDLQRDPMEWLKEIQELRTAGRNEEADRELALFRSVYPQIRAVYEVDGAAMDAGAAAKGDGAAAKGEGAATKGDGAAAESEGSGARSAAPRPPTK